MKARSIIVSIGIFAIAATGALAQNRTWVSGVGDDGNPCSRSAPCKTFAGAIFKTAAGGQISVLDPGAYGTVTINKSITIDGGGELGSIVNFSVLSGPITGITVNAGPTDTVILRNLQIDGVGGGPAGIRIISAGSVHIEDSAILNQGDATNGRGIEIEPTAGITVNVFIHDVAIYHCAVNGIRAAPMGGTANVYMDDVRIASIGSSGTTRDGIDMQSGSNMSLNNVRVIYCTGSGLRVEASTVTVGNSVFNRNTQDGITVGPGIAVIRVNGSTLTQNSGAGISATGSGQIFSYKNSRSSDNGLPDSSSMLANFN